MEIAILASPHLNQRLMEHLNTGIVLLDADLSIIFMNPAAEALLEVSGQRGRGVEFTMLARESDEAQAFRDALINGHFIPNVKRRLSFITSSRRLWTIA